jgi:hypothetical protein
MIAEFFHLAFLVCFIYNYYNSGGTFSLFYRSVDFINSIREKTPRDAKTNGHSLLIEFKVGNRLYCHMIPLRIPYKWVKAAVYVKGQWIEKTGEIEYYAGVCKDFGNIPITPRHLNKNYECIGFEYPDGSQVYAKANEIISLKLKDKVKQAKVENVVP